MLELSIFQKVPSPAMFYLQLHIQAIQLRFVRILLSWIVLGHDKPFSALWINEQMFKGFDSEITDADICNWHV